MSSDAPRFQKYSPPAAGHRITLNADVTFNVPDDPIIPFVEGDGTGVDITPVMRRVLNAGVEKAYDGERKICWYEIYAGEKAQKLFGELLPEDSLEALRFYHVGIKGPLTTPVGKGFRSLNVAFRQLLDLYACVRPARWITGAPTPVTHPEKLNVVVFREAVEDVYAGIEWSEGSPEVKKVIEFLEKEMGKKVRLDSGIGIKPISKFCSKRLIRRAIQWAIRKKYPTVTLMHKGNIMKYTEGAFRAWGYELAEEEFADMVVSEDKVAKNYEGKVPAGKVVINDRIADSIFQQVLLRPEEYGVIATMNLNGDYIADALAAQVSGLGLAPSSNLGDGVGLFEAVHGSAPKYAGQDKVNPTALIMSGCMMLEHMGWDEVAGLVVKAVERTIASKVVTYDLARQIKGAREVRCSQYGEEIIKNM